MRIPTLIGLTVAATIALACSTSDAPIAKAQPPQPPPIVDCVPDESSTTNKCANLLPTNWRNDLATTFAAVTNAAAFTAAPVKKVRDAGAECRKTPGGTVDAELNYTAALAMQVFPLAGTNGRELVTAAFETLKDINKCWEFKYGVIKSPGSNDRVAYFTAAVTGPGSQKGTGIDRVIGRWETYAIRKLGNGPGAQYKLDTLRHGVFVQCGFEHATTYGDISFISCEDARKFHAEARETSNPDSAFRSLIAEVNAGVEKTIKRLIVATNIAPAWARCGNLGCCALE